MDDWDRTVWQAMTIIAPHTGKQTPGFYELHPLRDKAEAEKDNQFDSQEDIAAFLESFNTNSNGD